MRCRERLGEFLRNYLRAPLEGTASGVPDAWDV
jgi:hypothetical protein